MDGVTSNSGTTTGKESIARLFAALGTSTYLNMQYGVNASSTSSNLYVPTTLSAFGYQGSSTGFTFQTHYLSDYPGSGNVTYQSIQRVKNHFEQYTGPVYVRSEDKNGAGGHAWIIDGYMKVETMSPVYQGQIRNYAYYYCNWGWNGKANGWYRGGFNTSVGPNKGEEGEHSTTQNYNFSVNTEVLLNIHK